MDFKTTATEPAATITFPVDTTHLPPGRRGHPLNDIAGFTSTSTDSHVMGFGEYCALYLANWSNITWNWNPKPLLSARKEAVGDLRAGDRPALPESRRVRREESGRGRRRPGEDGPVPRGLASRSQEIPRDRRRALRRRSRRRVGQGQQGRRSALFRVEALLGNLLPETVPPDSEPNSTPKGDEKESDIRAGNNTREERNRLARALTPSWFAGVKYFGVEHESPKKDGKPQDELITKKDAVLKKVRRLDWFYKDLPRVRRVLANIPSYMVFDDHEITDDWNLTPKWAKQTRASALGRAVIRNGLAAGTLFQSWGNDPRAYRQGIPRSVLELIATLFASPTAAEPGPDKTAAGELERRFDLQPPTSNDTRMIWHFRYDGPGFEVIALDSRTWRGFEPQANEQIRSRFDPDATATLADGRSRAPADPRAAGDRRRRSRRGAARGPAGHGDEGRAFRDRGGVQRQAEDHDRPRDAGRRHAHGGRGPHGGAGRRRHQRRGGLRGRRGSPRTRRGTSGSRAAAPAARRPSGSAPSRPTRPTRSSASRTSTRTESASSSRPRRFWATRSSSRSCSR